jgi:ubiquinone/menaquinone biosynthesis C-methylase UbiE
MDKDFNAQSFWNRRFGRVGHTGELNPSLYIYDQPHRLRAIEQALLRAGIRIGSDSKVLDIGCGTGDVIEQLMKYDEPSITGIDISNETIEYAERRFASQEKVRLITVGLENMDFPESSFDLIIGVNVLQHLTDERIFRKAIEDIVKLTAGLGHVLVMDFSPVKVIKRQPAPYVVYRSRREYIDAFTNASCRLVTEFGLPRIGVRLHRSVGAMGGIARKFGFLSKQSADVLLDDVVAENSRSMGMGDRMRSMALKFALPFDNLLSPIHYRFTDMRILVFQVALK